MPFSRLVIAAGTLVCAATAVTAQAEVTGSVEAGVLMTSGNSESTSANAGFKLNQKRGKWTNEFSALAYFAQQETEIDDPNNQGQTTTEDETTAENYAVGARTAYDFTKNNYAFGEATWNKDLFAGVRERTTQAVGYGRRLLNGDVHKLDLELGAGARQEEDQQGVSTSGAIGRAGLKYNWVISDTSKFSQTFLVETGSDNTYSESVTGLKLSVVGPTFINITYTVKNNSDVPPDTENTDSFLAVNLSYAFGDQ